MATESWEIGNIDNSVIGATTPAAGAFTTLTASGNVTPANLTASKPVFTDGSKNLVSTGTLAVDQGGTGAGSLTDHGIVLGSGTGAVTVLAVATNGQLPIGSTGADPVLAALTEGEGIDITNGAGSIQIDCEDASETNKGVAELATDAETVTGTATDKVTTPANVTAKMAAPGAIGGTTPAAGAFTTIAASGNVTPDTLTASKIVASDASKHLVSVEPTVFERGGAQEIDGDHLDIDMTPINYVPDTSPAEAAHVDDLAAHLKGIDNALGEVRVIGVEWDQSTDTWTRIDEDGTTLVLATANFDAHPVWGRMRRVNLDANGQVAGVHGETGFAHDGTNGRVMVETPKFFVKSERPEANVYRWFISPVARAGFIVHPWFVQGGGQERDYAYVGAYEADFNYDGDDAAYNASNIKLHSRTGKQPMTGEQIVAVQFDGGQNEPTIGDSLETATDSGWLLVDYLKTGGTWAGNDATGYLWVRKPGDDACGFADDEDITNTTQTNTLAGGGGLGVNGAVAALALNIADVRTYAQNIGTRWQQMSIWALSAIRMLYYVEYAHGDSQSTSNGIGKGVTDKASGTGFAGELTGADSADTNVGSNGSGTGTGTDGLTPTVYRGIENLWGNTYTWIDGYNAIDAEYQVLTAEGDIVPKDDMDDAQTPLSSTSAPITSDGYQSNILWDEGFELLLLPTAVAGASSSHLYDQFYAHDAGEVNVLLFGGGWSNGAMAGVACLYSNSVASGSHRDSGGRVEFV